MSQNTLPTHDQAGPNGLPVSANASQSSDYSDSAPAEPALNPTAGALLPQGHHENCDVNDQNTEGIRKPCNCGGRAPAPNANITICGWCSVFMSGDSALYKAVREGAILPSTGICPKCLLEQKAKIFAAAILRHCLLARKLIEIGNVAMAMTELARATEQAQHLFKLYESATLAPSALAT